MTTRGECDCYVIIHPSVLGEGYAIVYCPKHKSAPDMYEALKHMLYLFDRELPAQSIGLQTCNNAKDALAKARGK